MKHIFFTKAKSLFYINLNHFLFSCQQIVYGNRAQSDSNPIYPNPPTTIQPASIFCQTAQKDKYLNVEATILKYMHRFRPSHCNTEIMTWKDRADIYEAKVFMTFGPHSAQTQTTNTNTHLSLVHIRATSKRNNLSHNTVAALHSLTQPIN